MLKIVSIKNIQFFIKDFLKNFKFSSKSEKEKFKQQINQDIEQIVSEIEEDKKNQAIDVSYQMEIDTAGSKTSIKDTLDAKIELNEFNRLSILDHIKEQFLRNLTHHIKKYDVHVCQDRVKIWTLISYPEDEKYHTNIPIVCIHGYGSGVCQWVKVLDTLSEKHPVYLFDIPGFGKSSRPKFNNDGNINLTATIDMIDQWLEKVGISTPFVILGHSFGCYLSVAYAIRHPNRIHNIILLDPWGIYDLKQEINKSDSSIKLFGRIGDALSSFISPFSLMKQFGPIGKYIFKTLKNHMHKDFENIIDRDLFFDYFYYCNVGSNSGEDLYKSLQTNLFFAKYPLVSFMSDLPSNITVRLFVGELSFVNTLNESLSSQLENVLGKDRVKTHFLKNIGHHFYACSSFIELMGKISLVDINDIVESDAF